MLPPWIEESNRHRYGVPQGFRGTEVIISLLGSLVKFFLTLPQSITTKNEQALKALRLTRFFRLLLQTDPARCALNTGSVIPLLKQQGVHHAYIVLKPNFDRESNDRHFGHTKFGTTVRIQHALNRSVNRFTAFGELCADCLVALCIAPIDMANFGADHKCRVL